MNSLSSLFQEIEKYLESDEEKLNYFNLLKADYHDGIHDNREIFDQLYELIKDNEQLSSSLDRAKSFFGKEPSPIDLVSNFTLYFTKTLSDSPELIQLLTHATSLFIEDFISFGSLSYFINLTCPNLFNDQLEELKKGLDENFRYIRQKSLPNIQIPNAQNILLTKKPSIGSEFLLLISMLIKDPEQQKSILKCLKLYGMQFIPYETAFNWIHSINEFIASIFEEQVNVLNAEPSSFIPNLILSELSESNSEIQLMWAFGNDFYNFLKQMPTIENNARSAIQLNNSRILEKTRKLNHHTEKAAVYIAELQSIKFFTTLKASGQALRKNEQLITSIPEGVIECIFGQNSQIDKTDVFYRILFNKCYEYGEKATKIEMTILRNKFAQLNPSSPEGRTAFHELVRPSVVLREIVFSGAVLETPSDNKVLNIAFAVAEKTVGHFTNLSQKYDKLVKAIKNAGQFDVDDYAALSIYYFVLLSSLIEKVDPSKYSIVQQIPDLIFKEASPLQQFESETIANVDMVLKNFVQNLHKADEKQFFGRSTPNFHNDFVFHLNIGKNVVISKGIMNSISYLDSK